MNTSLEIGRVIEVRGTRIRILVNEEMNHSTLIYQGEIINNVTVNGFVVVKKGIIDIVGKIDAEYIEDLKNSISTINKDHRFNRGSILRVLEIQIVGYFEKGNFQSGVRHLPMIGNLLYIPTQDTINEVYEGSKVQLSAENNCSNSIVLGKSIYEDIDIKLSINQFFASHIGIFGNTGSGKSNTLTKLYYELFNARKTFDINDSSSFHVIDFNGEYAHEGIFGLSNERVNIIEVGSGKENSKIVIEEKYFYDGELLSILFNAKEQTQKPFIKRLLKRMSYASENDWTISTWLKHLYAKALVNKNKGIFDYVRTVLDYLMNEIKYSESESFRQILDRIEWHSMHSTHFVGTEYFSSIEHVKIIHSNVSGYKSLNLFCESLDEFEFSWFDSFIINSKLNLVNDMLNKYAQFDHINPLINRIESRLKEFKKTIIISDNIPDPLMVSIYSFRNCSTDLKQMLPPLIVKNILAKHKEETVQEKINKTVHLIIDEAHNILSDQINREGNDWHDYRLDVFEEIIKEGRKFGVYLTIASQRPSDISSTIISQIHNYFIHRLVNDLDLKMIDSTISTLDRVSRSTIPTLSSGSCVVTGTALAMPIFMQVEEITSKSSKPNSDNVNLIDLWNEKNG